MSEAIDGALRRYLSPIIASSILQSICARLGTRPSQLRETDLPSLLDHLERSLTLYLRPDQVAEVLSAVRKMTPGRGVQSAAPAARTIDIAEEVDIREARIVALKLARSVGFDHPDATKVATVVSELARNIVQYAGRGSLRIEPLGAPRRAIRVVARDDGPGIAELDSILDGSYRSPNGLGLGLRGSRQIMDSFSITSAPGAGTSITAVKYA